MERTRIKLATYVDLDPVPGAFHSADSARNHVAGFLTNIIPHYNPTVSIESYDVSKIRTPEPLWMYATTKNSGPSSMGPDPKTLVYLGTDVAKAEEAVGNFVKYQKDEDQFPKNYIDLYSAIPKEVGWELIQYYMADGWWYSIVRFNCMADS